MLSICSLICSKACTFLINLLGSFGFTMTVSPCYIISAQTTALALSFERFEMLRGRVPNYRSEAFVVRNSLDVFTADILN